MSVCFFQACRSFTSDQNSTGFISYDSKAQITYISSQYPEQKELYSVLRQACVRRYMYFSCCLMVLNLLFVIALTLKCVLEGKDQLCLAKIMLHTHSLTHSKSLIHRPEASPDCKSSLHVVFSLQSQLEVVSTRCTCFR